MKLLLTSDLHRNGKKLLWLLEEAPAHDALLVAGDQLEIFSNTPPHEQISGVRRWTEAVLASGKPLICCSGNHDFFQGESTPRQDASPQWMRETLVQTNLLTDGETRILKIADERMAFTTLLWPVSGEDIVVNGYRTTFLDFVKRLLQMGRKLKDEEGVPWMLLIHEPPARTRIAAGYEGALEADFTRRILEASQPDFSLHGHIHEAPDHPEGHWWANVGQTVAFNSGQTAPRELPNAILLQIDPNRTWHAQRLEAGQAGGADSETGGKIAVGFLVGATPGRLTQQM